MKRNQKVNGKDWAQRKASEYATAEEFCKIFTTDLKQLYLLSLMLTGTHRDAEQSFMSAFVECQKQKSVFKPWARSWSRLAVIESAIKVVNPTAGSSEEAVIAETGGEAADGLSQELARVTRLDAFHRFVFVLVVLEGYSVRDCAILLKRGKREIESAKLRAISILAAQDGSIFKPAANVFAASLSA